MKNNIFKKGIAVLLSAAMSICLYGCGSKNNNKDAQDEIIDVIEATKEVFSDSLQKGVYGPLIENGQVNRTALYNNVEDTFNYELL